MPSTRQEIGGNRVSSGTAVTPDACAGAAVLLVQVLWVRVAYREEL